MSAVVFGLVVIFSLPFVFFEKNRPPLQKPDQAEISRRFESLNDKKEEDRSPAAKVIRSRYQASDYDKALELANEALKDHPQDSEIHSLKAESLIVLGRDREALETLRDQLKRDPSNERNLRDILSLIEIGPVEEEARALLKSLSHKSPEAAIILALQLRREGNKEQAQALYEDLYREYPKNERVLRELSFRNFQYSNFSESLAYLKEWRELIDDPKTMELSFDLQFQNELGRFKKLGRNDFRDLEASIQEWKAAQTESRLALERQLYLEWLKNSNSNPR